MSVLKLLSGRLTAISGNLEAFEIRHTAVQKSSLKKLENLTDRMQKIINGIYESEEKVRNTNF